MSAAMSGMWSVARGRTSGVVTRSRRRSARNVCRVARGQLADGDARGGRVADDLVVDVGDVHDPRHRVALPGQVAAQQVGEQEAPEVADVGGRIDRRAAAVHAHVRRVERLERLERAAQRVPEAQRHRGHHADERAWRRWSGRHPRRPTGCPVDACTATALGVDAQQLGEGVAHRVEPGAAEARPGARMVRSSDAGRKPAAREPRDDLAQQLAAVDAARRRRRQPGTGGRGRPCRAAASSASQMAWSAASPSEWPCRRGASGMSMPRQAQAVAGCRRGGCRCPTRTDARRPARRAPPGAAPGPASRSAGSVILRSSASPGTVATGDAVAGQQLRLVAEQLRPIRARHRWPPAAARAARPGASAPGTASRGRRCPSTTPVRRPA